MKHVTAYLLQSNSGPGSVAVSECTLNHLSKVAERLLQVEVELYEKGRLFDV